MVLTWGASPTDLDSYTVGSGCHVYYGSPVCNSGSGRV